MANFVANLWRNQRGQDMTEYALMGGLVASVTVAIVPEMLSIAGHIHTLLLAVLQAAVDIATLK
jgi:Flp pilus assembly pilin Flp